MLSEDYQTSKSDKSKGKLLADKFITCVFIRFLSQGWLSSQLIIKMQKKKKSYARE